MASIRENAYMLERVKSIRDALTRTRQAAFGRVATLLGATEITPEFWDELEALLIQADLGVETTADILEKAKAHVKREGIIRTDALKNVLKATKTTANGPPGRPSTMSPR